MTYAVKNILWATDFSAEANNALLDACFFAEAFKAKLSAVYIFPELQTSMFESRPAILEDLYKQAEAGLEKSKKRLEALAEKKGIHFAKIIVDAGSPAKKILEIAKNEKADLVVMGKKGRSAIEKVLVGSVANGVLRHATMPVLVTGRRRARPGIGKILVPTDFSRREEIERDLAWILASTLKADLTFLHVLELHDFSVPPEYSRIMLGDVLKKMQSRKTLQKKGFSVSDDVIRASSPSTGIVDYAKANGFDLIVISTTTHTAIGRFFLGSNTEKVLSHSSVPVFAIPAAFDE